MSTKHKPGSRLCPVCASPVPEKSSRTRVYCSQSCKAKAANRKRAGKPVADPAATPGEVANLLATIAELQKRNQKSERLIARLRQLLRKHRAQSARAQSAIETAQRKERRAELEVTQSVQNRIANLIAEKRELQEQLLARKDYEEIKQTLEETNRFAIEQSMQFKQMMDQMQQRLTQLQSTTQVSGSILNDYFYFANYYFKKKPRELWDFSDTSRLQRFKQHSQRTRKSK
ncbi:hypothetical protein ACN08Y_10735 [Rothia sp. P5764]|uniref:hypothetical protein n=1 Tax=Rothia sp. P5764 TaxID=3402654 RepID=UPI003AD21C34